MAGVQKPHWMAPVATKACCSGGTPAGGRPPRCAAPPGLAAVLEAVDPQVLAQRAEQGGIPGDPQLGLFAVEPEGDHHVSGDSWASRDTRISATAARSSELAP